MTLLVIDTNVLVSGLLSPHSHSAVLIRLVAGGSVSVAFDDRILAEYREVLARPKFPFKPAQIETLLTQVEEEGLKVTPQPVSAKLPDADDVPFLEVALAANVDFLVTGNMKHYPLKSRRGIKVISPRQCIELLRR